MHTRMYIHARAHTRTHTRARAHTHTRLYIHTKRDRQTDRQTDTLAARGRQRTVSALSSSKCTSLHGLLSSVLARTPFGAAVPTRKVSRVSPSTPTTHRACRFGV
jgi:hypothetical protein